MNNPNLAILRSLLTAIRSVQQGLDGINKHQSAVANQQGQSPPQINAPVEIALPPSVTHYYASEQSEKPQKARWEKARFLLGVGTLLAAIAAAIFTFQNLLIMQKQLAASGQRAWIGIDTVTVKELRYECDDPRPEVGL